MRNFDAKRGEWREYEPRSNCYFGGGTSTTTSTQELAPEQRELLGLVIPEARRISENTPQLYPNSSIAGFDPLQLAGQQGVLDAAGNIAGAAQSGANANQFLTSGAVLDPNRNPGLQGAVRAATRPLTREFETSVLPGIRQDFITAGGYGGSRQGIAEGLATQGYFDALGDTAARVVNPAYQAGLSAFTQGIQNIPTVQEGFLTAPQAVEAVGSQRRTLSQQQLSEEAQRYLSEQILPFSVAQDIAALAFGIGGGQSTTRSQGAGTDPLSAILGIGALGLGGFNAGLFG